MSNTEAAVPQNPNPAADHDLSRVHMIGIGGAGMSGLAQILLSRGAVVTGSDVKESAVVAALRDAGATIAVGHDAANLVLGGAQPTVVVTSFAAIPQDNPELVACRAAGIPLLRRSDLLAELMAGHRQVLFAGTHGKTSSTSMAVEAFRAAGLDPSFAIGGKLNSAGVNAASGMGESFVAEADESDASLLRYSPEIAIITNVEPDHLDYFHSPEAYFKVFDEFADRVTPGGRLAVCLDDAHAVELGARSASRGIHVVGFGSSAAAEDVAQRHPEIEPAVTVRSIQHTEATSRAELRDESTGETTAIELHVPGDHMVLNAAGALTAGLAVGGDLHKLAEGLSAFRGVGRRFEYHGERRGVQVYDDYAHHPTEVRAVISAAKEMLASRGSGNLTVIFQPHLYSRTKEFAPEFARALSLADRVIVLDVFGAREQPVPGINGDTIAGKVTTDVVFEQDFDAAPELAARGSESGDIILTMGAGSVTTLADRTLAALEQEG